MTNQCRREQVSCDKMWMKQLHYVGTWYADKYFQTSKFIEKKWTELLDSVVNVITGITCSKICQVSEAFSFQKWCIGKHCNG